MTEQQYVVVTRYMAASGHVSVHAYAAKSLAAARRIRNEFLTRREDLVEGATLEARVCKLLDALNLGMGVFA